MNETVRSHGYGEITTYKEQLVALGGINTPIVEVFQNGTWDHTVIQMIGNYYPIASFSTLSIRNDLYVFGKYIFNTLLLFISG